MAVKFFSVRSGEVKLAETEPMIAAFFNSSDLNPNGIVQDYGWRLHPDIVKQIRALEADEEFIEKLADKMQIPVENVATYHILMHISDREDREKRKKEEVEGNKFQEQYDAELAAALAADDEESAAEGATNAPASTAGSTTKRAAGGKKPKVSTPAEIAAQKKLDDEKLAQLIAEDDNKK